MPLLVVGSIAFDTIETPHGRAEHVLGGSANYFSLAASRLAPVRLVGVIGSDFPNEHLAFLAGQGVDVAGVERREGRTFNWTGRYEGDMAEAETLEVNLEVFEHFRPQLPPEFTDSQYIFLANAAPETQLHVLQQLDHPKFVMADTMNHWIATARHDLLEMLKHIDALVLNDNEARMLTESQHTVAAGKAILEHGPWMVIIKKGEHGSLLITKEFELACPGYPLIDITDPTGAGDSFAGGFIGYLSLVKDLSTKSLKKALKYGTVFSSYNCEEFSINRLKALTRSDIERRLAAFEDML